MEQILTYSKDILPYHSKTEQTYHFSIPGFFANSIFGEKFRFFETVNETGS